MAKRSRNLRGLRIVSSENQREGQDQEIQNEPEHGRQEQAEEVIDNDSIEMSENNGRRHNKRGRTTMAAIWNMDSTERIYIEVDKEGVPCTKEGATLSSFLGTVAENGTFAPLNISRWDRPEFEPFQKKMLKLVESKFVYPPATKKWILNRLSKRWRDYKSDLKAEYYGSMSKEQIIQKVPEGVLEDQWCILVNSWYTQKSQAMSAINTANAKKQKNTHTCGRKSYARTRKEMEKANGRALDRLEFFEATHKKKDGQYVDETTRQIMEMARARQAELAGSSPTNPTEINEQIFEELLSSEHGQRLQSIRSEPTSTSEFTNAIYSNEVKVLQEQLNSVSADHKALQNEVNALKSLINEKFPGQQVLHAQVNHSQVNDGDGHVDPYSAYHSSPSRGA